MSMCSILSDIVSLIATQNRDIETQGAERETNSVTPAGGLRGTNRGG